MNHHGDKLTYPGREEDEGLVDAALGGIVEEFHSCAGCGRTHSRPAQIHS
ncbi:MAG TPA: hypothetical protein VFB00_07325 [Terriglobales bacterium]|nr:hypothetical protein [Terriglobales bacterium]